MSLENSVNNSQQDVLPLANVDAKFISCTTCTYKTGAALYNEFVDFVVSTYNSYL